MDNSLEIRPSPGRGRGIFALRNFQAGEEITLAPVIPLSVDDSFYIRGRSFSHNLYEWIPLPNEKWTLALVGGIGLFINHSYHPNADYDRDYLRKGIVYYAIQDISKNEEIFINYNGDPESQEPVCFDVT